METLLSCLITIYTEVNQLIDFHHNEKKFQEKNLVYDRIFFFKFKNKFISLLRSRAAKSY